MRKLMFASIFGIFLFAANGTATAQDCKPLPDQVAVFTEIDHKGECRVLDIDEYNNVASLGLNSPIYSVEVGSEVTAELCYDQSFEGPCLKIKTSRASFPVLKRINSLKIFKKSIISPVETDKGVDNLNRDDNAQIPVKNPSDKSGEFLITTTSVGPLKLGMTVAEARKVLTGFTIAVTAPGGEGGFVSLGAFQGDKLVLELGAYSVRPDENGNLPPIDENEEISSIGTSDSRYSTKDGVRVGTTISEAEKYYGKLNSIFSAPYSLGEHGHFSNSPMETTFRFSGKEGTDASAGDYEGTQQLDYGQRTTKYNPGAYISGIAISFPQWGGDGEVSSVESPPNKTNCNPGDEQIAIFAETNYEGDCVVKNIGFYDTPEKMGVPFENISSIKVGKDVRSFICFQGGNVRENCLASPESHPSALADKAKGKRLQFIRVTHLDRPFGGTPYSIGTDVLTADNKRESQCLEVFEENDDVEVKLVKCGASKKQRWLFNSMGEIQGFDYKCLTFDSNGVDQIRYSPCDRLESQKWTRIRDSRQFRNAANGKCLSREGARMIVQDCLNSRDQWVYMGRKTVEKVTAGNVKVIEFSGGFDGSFRSYPNGVWAEYESGNPKPLAYYNETGRDEWSVYLKKNDGTIIQFDLHKNEILRNGTYLHFIGYTSN